MAAEAAVFSGRDPFVAGGQSCRRDIMTIGTNAGICIFGFTQLRNMRIVAGVTTPLDRRSMTNSIDPILIDIVAPQAEGRLFPKQVVTFVVTMGVMAD